MNKFNSFTICIHNSLVGQTTKAWGNLSAVLINCNNGKPNAAVLPVPVCANPIKSFVPLIKTGIERSWISVACVYPNSVTAFTLSGNYKAGSFTLIPELRLDSNSEDVFVDSDMAATGSASQFLLAVVYGF